MTKLVERWFFGFAVASAIAVLILTYGIQSHSRVKADQVNILPVDLSGEAVDKLAQAYFRLGVATSCHVITKHLLAGEPVPEAKALEEECIQMDISSSNGATRLKSSR